MVDNSNARRSLNKQHALMLAQVGIAVFPSSGKVPLIPVYNKLDTTLSKEERDAAFEEFKAKHDGEEPAHVGCTRNPEVIKKMWRVHRDAVPSVACGPSGLVVLDADQKDEGPAKMQTLWDENGGVPKPRAKLAAFQSYDTLVADFVEAALKSYPNFRFHTPRAFDAYFDVVGWPCLLTHGDRMSAGGGTGFIGPAANIVKGHKKVMLTEAQQRRPVRFIFSGHFHTRLVTPWGFANGSLIGFSEFAKAIRADAEPAQQNFVVLHERLGLLREQPIVLGTPDEGSIYAPNGGLILPDITLRA